MASFYGIDVALTFEISGSFEETVSPHSVSAIVETENELVFDIEARILSDMYGTGVPVPIPGESGLLKGQVVLDIREDHVFTSFIGQAQPAGFKFTIEGLTPQGFVPGSISTNGWIDGVNTANTPGYEPGTGTLTLNWNFLGYQPGTVVSQTVFYDAPVGNNLPTDISISHAAVNQSSGNNASVGLLTTTDLDLGDTHTYTLVAGVGDTHNASFNISGSALRVNDARALSDGSYTIRVRTTDSSGGTYEKSLTVTIVDDIPPPPPTIDTPAGPITGDSKPTFTGTAEQHSIVSVYAGTTHLGTTTANGSGTWSFTPGLPLSDGDQAISAAATDLVGNTSTSSAETFITIDTTSPTVTSVAVPADGTYKAGQQLDFAVNFDETVTVDTTNGTPQIAITLDAGYKVFAQYVSGSGTTLILFSLTIEPNWLDKDGIELGHVLDLDGGMITDQAGNTVISDLNAVGSTSGILVDAVSTNDGGGGTPTPQPEPEPEPEQPPEEIPGSPGDDVFQPSPVDAVYDGGDGFDNIVYTGTRDSYDVTVNADGTIVLVGAGYTHTLIAMDRVQFDDGTLAFDFDGAAGQAYRLYKAAFGREPDLEGLSYWINRLDTGTTSLGPVAESFLNSPEFIATYGTEETVTNAQYIELLYINALGREPDEDGFAYWVDRLDGGQTNRIDLLAFFSESDENSDAVAPTIHDGIWYV